MKRIRISSSIANFHDRLRARYEDYGDFKWFSKDPTIFFGMYHIGDYLRLICHRGPATVFFCGSDILSLPQWMKVPLKNSYKYVENDVEAKALFKYLGGILNAVVMHPMLFDDPEKYQVTYEHSNDPKVWMTYHRRRGQEYGVDRFFKVCEKAGVTGTAFCGAKRKDFINFTNNYQATIRFNKHDGFSENLALAMLRGQYAFSVIPYPDIETITDDETLIEQLKELKNKKEPHDTSYWREQLSKRIEI